MIQTKVIRSAWWSITLQVYSICCEFVAFTFDVFHPHLSKLRQSRFWIALLGAVACHVLFHYGGVITLCAENGVCKPPELNFFKRKGCDLKLKPFFYLLKNLELHSAFCCLNILRALRLWLEPPTVQSNSDFT
jgi:hypothetical protein